MRNGGSIHKVQLVMTAARADQPAQRELLVTEVGTQQLLADAAVPAQQTAFIWLPLPAQQNNHRRCFITTSAILMCRRWSWAM